MGPLKCFSLWKAVLNLHNLSLLILEIACGFLHTKEYHVKCDILKSELR